MSLRIILLTLFLGRSQGEVLVNPAASGCVDESAIYQNTYHAPARAVPVPEIQDLQLMRNFMELFRRGSHEDHEHESPQDAPPLCVVHPSPLSPEMTALLNAHLPRNDTFKSFSQDGGHKLAVYRLTEEFNKAKSDMELYVLVKELLHSHTINQRLWYHALVAVLITRPDLNHIVLPRAIDITPDSYVTYSILRLARAGTNETRRSKSETCTTSNGLTFNYLNFTSVASHDVAEITGLAGDSQLPRAEQPDPCEKPVPIVNEIKTVTTTYVSVPYTSFTYKAKEKWIADSYHPGYHRHIHYHHPTYNTDEVGGKSDEYHGGYLKNRSKNPFVDVLLSPPFDVLGSQKKRSTPTIASENQETTNDNFKRVHKRQAKQNQCILYNGTRGATGEENRLWYFREDMSLNEHHWYWHQHYSALQDNQPDRNGEVFFFVHREIVARYNAERLSNGLPLVKPLEFYEGGDIGPGYNSDLLDEFTGRFWTPRLANMPLSDFDGINLNEVANSFSTLRFHVAQGFLLTNRSKEGLLPLNIKNSEGLSHLGITAEGHSRHSVNIDLYKSVHDLSHLAISVATDPGNNCSQLLDGVMEDNQVAMRDPGFYRVHALVDTLYTKHKNTLPPYQLHGGEWPLQWDGVRLQSVEVLPGNGQKINHLKTFWSLHQFRLEEGIDGLIHEGDMQEDVCHQHLNHEKFTFKLIIDMDSCAKTVSNMGTVRIFMAPRYNLDGRRFTMEETRSLLFQLDVFPVQLRRGRNTITRNSQDSSATKPWSRTLQQMLDDPTNGNQPEYCGCGWPNHLNIPRGREDQGGMAFDLFAMVTNFDEDQVIDNVVDPEITEFCISPYIYCGRPYKKYPDARPMGYPFDRLPYSVVEAQTILTEDGGYLEKKILRPVGYLEEYVAHVQNMQSAVLQIQHEDMIVS